MLSRRAAFAGRVLAEGRAPSRRVAGAAACAVVVPGLRKVGCPPLTGSADTLGFLPLPSGAGRRPACVRAVIRERCALAKVLVLTNDFPPRPGGIQFFVHALALRLPPENVTVYAPAWAGAAEFDAGLPFPVVRHPTSLMLPVPSVARRAERMIG